MSTLAITSKAGEIPNIPAGRGPLDIISEYAGRRTLWDTCVLSEDFARTFPNSYDCERELIRRCTSFTRPIALPDGRVRNLPIQPNIRLYDRYGHPADTEVGELLWARDDFQGDRGGMQGIRSDRVSIPITHINPEYNWVPIPGVSMIHSEGYNGPKLHWDCYDPGDNIIDVGRLEGPHVPVRAMIDPPYGFFGQPNNVVQ